ncbi:alkaline phosphatase-like isoform X1 [Polistes fuscatus]|uniref:alkaline phosphatase-like isoform X1 n=1 Tax=Polistes fuscatus TaxID=30207 RepID=UPI001CA9B02F|nr:alkaline phosphatase-like isoform X1 [Polistes fuscatus]
MCRYLQHTTTLALPLVLLAIHAITVVRAGEQEREVWYEGARRAIEARIRAATNSNGAGPGTGGTGEAGGGAGTGGGGGNTAPSAVARGVVLFVGDGMGMSTLTAARILSGQRHGNTGEEAQLAWDSFPAVALSRTYNMDAQVGESSACATALLCGVKANYETVGLDSSARFENCYSSFDAHVPSLINWAQGQGKSTGLVTTTRVTHATPAALYAHAASRYWEDDGKVPSASRPSCKDIARQLLEDEPGRNINVILGGGRRHFVPKVTLDPEEPDKEGRRLDGRNLIEEWSRNNRIRKVSSRYVSNKEQFDSVDPRQVNYLLGLFAYSHMDFDVDRNTNGTGDPSLTEMTLKALHILAKNPEGYFLFVEGGRIDHAHHYNNAYRALDETLALEKAVRAVMKEVDLTETLIVVTADHSHVLTLGGLATHRGNPILGSDSKVSDVDGQPYTTLLYSNGPGYTQPRNILRDAGKDSIQAVCTYFQRTTTTTTREEKEEKTNKKKEQKIEKGKKSPVTTYAKSAFSMPVPIVTNGPFSLAFLFFFALFFSTSTLPRSDPENVKIESQSVISNRPGKIVSFVSESIREKEERKIKKKSKKDKNCNNTTESIKYILRVSRTCEIKILRRGAAHASFLFRERFFVFCFVSLILVKIVSLIFFFFFFTYFT